MRIYCGYNIISQSFSEKLRQVDLSMLALRKFTARVLVALSGYLRRDRHVPVHVLIITLPRLFEYRVISDNFESSLEAPLGM